MPRRGFTLIEALIYIFVLLILVSGTVTAISILSQSGYGLRAERRIINAGEASAETLTREIRQASDVLLPSSTLGSSPGVLALRTVQSPGSQTPVTRTFSLLNSRLQKQDDSGAPEFLTGPEATITELFFWHSVTGASALVTFKFTVESGQGAAFKQKTFYGSAILRAKY